MSMERNPYDHAARMMAVQARGNDEVHGRGEQWFTPGKRPGKISIAITIMVLLALLVAGNFFWAKHAGMPVLRLGTSTEVRMADGGEYHETVTRSLGFSLHHFYGSSVDYKVIVPWGSEAEPPVILSDAVLEDLEAQLAGQYGGETDPNKATFAGLHVLYVEPLKSEVEGCQIICIMATGEYERLGSKIVEMDGAVTTAAVIQCQIKDGRAVLSKVWKPSGGDSYGYGMNSEAYREQFPEGKLICISDDAPMDAQRKRSEAARKGLTDQ